MADQSTTPPPATEALATREHGAPTPAVITTPEQYTQSLLRWQQERFHVLSPAVHFSGLPPQHGMVAALVQVNPRPEAGEVYRDPLFCKEGEVALSKIALSKIAQAAGMTIKTERTDPRTISHYWEVRATARFIGLDGTPQELDATVEYDLRDGSARVRGWSPRQLQAARAHGLRGAEARAINAAIRLFGIRQTYRVDELAQPFVCLRVMFQPDMSDPEQARLVTERALRGTTALYPHARGQLVASTGPEVLDVIGETPEARTAPRSVGSGSAALAEPDPSPDPDTPPTPDAVRVVDVRTRTGEAKGRKWTRYIIIDSRGEEHSTFDRAIADAAEQAKASRAWVEIGVEVQGQYRNLVKITPAGQQPSLLTDPANQ